MLHDLAQPPADLRGSGARGAGAVQGPTPTGPSRRRRSRPAAPTSPTWPTSSTASSRTTWHRRWERLPLKFTVMVVGRGRRGLAVRDHPDLPDQVQRADDRHGHALHAARARRPRHLPRRGLLQLPLADDPADSAPRPSATASTPRPASSSTTTRSSGARGASAPTSTASAASTPICGTSATWTTRGPSPPGSIMPAYPWLLTDAARLRQHPESVMRAHQILGVPYTDDEVANGIAAATRTGRGHRRRDRRPGRARRASQTSRSSPSSPTCSVSAPTSRKPEPVAVEEEIGAGRREAAETDAEPSSIEEAS